MHLLAKNPPTSDEEFWRRSLNEKLSDIDFYRDILAFKPLGSIRIPGADSVSPTTSGESHPIERDWRELERTNSAANFSYPVIAHYYRDVQIGTRAECNLVELQYWVITPNIQIELVNITAREIKLNHLVALKIEIKPVATLDQLIIETGCSAKEIFDALTADLLAGIKYKQRLAKMAQRCAAELDFQEDWLQLHGLT